MMFVNIIRNTYAILYVNYKQTKYHTYKKIDI